MSATPTATLLGLDIVVFALVILLVAPLVFFLLFYYYLSQLAGINQSLKEIVALLDDHWNPENEKDEVAKPDQKDA